MGRLEEVLAAVDNARRVVGRNASDLFSDPAGHLTKITDALRNTNAKYLPFVQDFIRSGKWSDIQDAENTGLSRIEIAKILGNIKERKK